MSPTRGTSTVLDYQDFPFIEHHPPERRERKKKFVVLYSCCCCCCCCLHTVGGAIGAVVGGMLPKEAELTKSPDYQVPSGQWLYWSSFLIAAFIGVIVGWIMMLPQANEYHSVIMLFGQAAGGVGIAIVLLGPLWLLGAGLIMACRIPLQKDPAIRAGFWRQLVWIMAGVVAGSVAGILVMWVIFIVMSAM